MRQTFFTTGFIHQRLPNIIAITFSCYMVFVVWVTKILDSEHISYNINGTNKMCVFYSETRVIHDNPECLSQQATFMCEKLAWQPH